MRDDRERLLDILEAIERTERYTERGRSAFERDELVQIWVLHHLQILGEAARALDDSFKAESPEIPWKQIIGMRNILVHHYFEIDTDLVWSVVENDLPVLKQRIQALL